MIARTEPDKNSFYGLVEYFNSGYSPDVRYAFTTKNLLDFARYGRKDDSIDVFAILNNYTLFCALAATLRNNGFSSIAETPCSELEYCLLYDAAHMDLCADGTVLRVRPWQHRAEWNQSRQAINSDLFSVLTEQGKKLRFAVAADRFENEVKVGKENVTNSHIMQFLLVGRGFRYIFSFDLLKQFCEYLVTQGYGMIDPAKLDEKKVYSALMGNGLKATYMLRPFELPTEFRIGKAVSEFQAALIRGRVPVNQQKRMRHSMFSVASKETDLKVRKEIFIKYLVNEGGFKWLACRADIGRLLGKLDEKSMLTGICLDENDISSAREAYIAKRRADHSDIFDHQDFIKYLSYAAEGEAGNLFPELPFGRRQPKRLSNQSPQNEYTEQSPSSGTQLVKR